jgi:predicted SnoaL-like aldol condensation-catalyzing enzyme
LNSLNQTIIELQLSGSGLNRRSITCLPSRIKPEFVISLGVSTRMQSDLEANKKSVEEFYDLIINKKDFDSARKFMGSRYKQHNPLVADHPEGLREFIQFLKTNYPEAKSEIRKTFADGDYVILHVHSVRAPDTAGRAIIEIFRLENGKIEEHWDVIQEIPASSANPNGMF